jgi:hypothetical protein
MINTHLSITIIDKTINNKIVCKTPFYKWYIKVNDMTKIILNLLGFENEIKSNLKIKINKNLKMKSKNIKILEIISYIVT